MFFFHRERHVEFFGRCFAVPRKFVCGLQFENHWYSQNQLKTSLQATPEQSGTLCQIFCNSPMQLSHICIHFRLPKNAYLAEVAGVTFSNSDPAPVPIFLIRGRILSDNISNLRTRVVFRLRLQSSIQP